MPGIVVFNRRWSVGSDDFVVPGIVLLLLHIGWIVVLSVILCVVDFGSNSECVMDLKEHMLGYIVILSGCIIVEFFISWVGMRGTILDTAPRASMQYLLYVRLGIFLVEVAWLIVGVIWIARHYSTCPMGVAKKAVLGIIICNWCVLLSVLVTTWCTFDAAGRSWVKMKRYQRSLREGRAKFRYKRSGSGHRNWRQSKNKIVSWFYRVMKKPEGDSMTVSEDNQATNLRALNTTELDCVIEEKAMREYQNSWNKRCRLLFCCLGHSDRHRNSFAEIAKLLSEFFRDLDVVPSDVVAGLVLLRKFQQMERQMVVQQQKNDTYQFLSGVPITPNTRFLDVNHPTVAKEVQTITHYLHYALAVYGWPMFMMVNSSTGCCQLCPYVRCYCLPMRQKRKHDSATIVEDNCCLCNYAALRKMCQVHNMEVVYATYHVEVGETPFFVAVDHEKRTVIISIRGTLSLQDVITDLNAEGEQLPTEPAHDDWLGHKGMVHAAEYIKKKLTEEAILIQAFNYSPEKGTQLYDLVLVGHSLGAGTAAILAILLKQEFPNLLCYAYSPPGGLLSMPAVEYTKAFITSVVLGKDVVPRIGLHQMEALRSDLINAIKRSQDPKWKIILGGVLCCCPEELKFDLSNLGDNDKHGSRDVTCHPSDSSIALTVHQPLYPPGRIIHIVRNHPKKEERMVKKHEPVYQALWAGNTEFDQVLISPVMIQDHMPDKVLDALEKLLINTGPAKPQRLLTESERHQLLSPSADTLDSTLDRTPPHRLVLETSFTDLQPDGVAVEDITSHGNMKHSLSWEYSSAVAAALDTSYENNQKRLHSSNVQSGADGDHKVDLLHDDWIGFAPLASPETLSDVSSVSSKGSHQKLNNGNASNRLSWGGVPMMETIAQSPAVQRPTQDSLGVYENHQIGSKELPAHLSYLSLDKSAVTRDSSTASLLANSCPQAISTPVGHQVVTEATVEMDPDHVISEKEPVLRSIDPSQLRLNIELLCQGAKTKQSGGDSTYASTSTERTIDRLFTPHEPKRVTFELSDSQESQETEREDSADSLYNSGESFVPTYPDYTTQQEYGNHLYSYARYRYNNNHTPSSSPTIEHSFSDVQLTSLPHRSVTQHSLEIGETLGENTNNIHETVTSLSPCHLKNFNVDSDINICSTELSTLLSSAPSQPPPPTESSL